MTTFDGARSRKEANESWCSTRFSFGHLFFNYLYQRHMSFRPKIVTSYLFADDSSSDINGLLGSLSIDLYEISTWLAHE